MRRYWCSALLLAMATSLYADEIWNRRSVYQAYLFQDYRARKIGDVLTITLDEITGADAQETRALAKNTSAGVGVSGTASTSALGQILRSFGYDVSGNVTSNRSLDGKANTTIDRKFNDRLSVVVIDVLPSGNLVVEGVRQRIIARELRTLRVFGIVRPADIGAYNTIQSQYIANLRFFYEGRGPESNFTNQGWGGRLFNKLWPF